MGICRSRRAPTTPWSRSLPIAAAASAWFAATRLPLIVAVQVADPGVVFSRVVTSQALTVGLLLLPMTMALGATFPIALSVAAGATSRIGAVAARVYSANTVGAIGGALVAGFVLIPQLGLRTTFHAAAILGALSGALCLAVWINSIKGTGSGAYWRSAAIRWASGDSIQLMKSLICLDLTGSGLDGLIRSQVNDAMG